MCDGSGTTPDKPCGWAAAIHRHQAGDDPEVRTISGGESNGTNNTSELRAAVYGLWYAHRVMGLSRGDRVLVVSDSEITVRAGQGKYSRDAQEPMWRSVDWYTKDLGVVLDWVWVPRNSNPIHAWCDAESRRCRLLMEGKDG